MAYRIKHSASGYYYAGGGRLSKTGKTYTSEKDNILDKSYKDSNSTEDTICIYMVSANSPVYKATKDTIKWVKGAMDLYHADIPKSEFEKETIGSSVSSYKVKHKPTGLYFSTGSKLNNKGKIYTNKSILDGPDKEIMVCADSPISSFYKNTKDIIKWEKLIGGKGNIWFRAFIPKDEFEKEYV